MYKEYHNDEIAAAKKVLISYQRHQLLRQKLQQLESQRQFRNYNETVQSLPLTAYSQTVYSQEAYDEQCQHYYEHLGHYFYSDTETDVLPPAIVAAASRQSEVILNENHWNESSPVQLKEYRRHIGDPVPRDDHMIIVTEYNHQHLNSESNHYQYYYQRDQNHQFYYHQNNNYRAKNGFQPKKMQREEVIIERSQLVGNETTATSHPECGSPPGHNGPKLGLKIHRSHHFTQIMAALAVSLGPLAAGLGKGYSSPALASLQDTVHINNRKDYSFSVDDQEASWIASLSLLGAFFGGLFGGFFMQYGRKTILTFVSIPFSISWLLTVFASSVKTMYVTASIGGFCCAIVGMVTQVYISEIASPEIRGCLSAIQKVASHFGVLISYILGSYLDWRQLAVVPIIPAMMLFGLMMYACPETPSYLLLKGRDDDAYRSLQWLRGSEKNVEVELETIRANIRSARLGFGIMTETTNGSTTTGCQITPSATTTTTIKSLDWMRQLSFSTIIFNVKAVLRNARLIKPITITCGLMIFQRLTGANSFGFYAVNIFRKTFTNMSPHGGAIAVGFVQLLAACLSGLLIDTIGRIPLLIVSSVFMTLALAGFGSYSYYEQANKFIATNLEENAKHGSSDWIALLCVLVFTVAFSLGISPISWLLVGELFPLEYRGIGSSIATSFSYFCAFLGVKTFVDFMEILGLYGTYWLYACISMIGLFFVIMIVPETKGRDLDEMDPRYVRAHAINR